MCDDQDLRIDDRLGRKEMIRLRFQTEYLAGQIEGPDLAPPVSQRFCRCARRRADRIAFPIDPPHFG
jgi:hypothetical protein